jgi:hypothetical protein
MIKGMTSVRTFLTFAFCLLPFALTASPQAPAVNVAAARAHVESLAARIGSRPIGSAANAKAREYIAGELTRLGFAVRLQEADAVDASRGLTAHVVNIIAVRDGARSDAVALVSHYDSVPDGPGAADDALGVATCLESARLLSSAPMQHSLFVIVTDGEEVGLMGARAAVTDPEVAVRVKSVLNFDGTGAARPAFMFQAGPGRAAPFDAWASSAERPRGASFAVEIYRRLPNDTDFTVFRAFGAAGLDFAPLGDSYAYHTDRDVPSRLDPGVIHDEIANTVATVRDLDASGTAVRPESPIYFDLLGWFVVVMSPAQSAWLSWAACAVGAVAWLMLTVALYRERGVTGLLLTAAWSLVAAVAAVGAMAGAVAVVRDATSAVQPWYASPNAFFIFMALAGCLVSWMTRHFATTVPDRFRPVRTPAAAWWTTLPVWIAVTASLQIAAPVAAYLFSVPLAAAGVLVAATMAGPAYLRPASLVVAAVSAMLWVSNLLVLFSFVVSLFGWTPVVPPVWLWPAIFAVAALALAPPLVAAASGWIARPRASRLTGLLLAGLFCWSAAGALLSLPYTADRPQMRTARYVQDDIGGERWLEVGGNERAFDLGSNGPAGGVWQCATDAIPAAIRIGSLGSPFVFRSPAPGARLNAPATIRSSVTPGANGRLNLDLSIVPRESVVVHIVLPQGVRPESSSIAGVVVGDRWSGTYVAPPASGLDVHLAFAGRVPADLQQTAVVLITHGLPGAADATGRPAWLSTARAAWRTRSYFIVSAAPGISR